jgi:Cu+-exporting ATPase
VTIVMLTGDGPRTAEAVAAQLGITHLEAEVLPERKIEAVRELRERGRKVVMAGDAVNDAPALAAADVGVAMGTGTDVAMQSAGMTLNLFFAFVYNALGVPAMTCSSVSVIGNALRLRRVQLETARAQ